MSERENRPVYTATKKRTVKRAKRKGCGCGKTTKRKG